jgi:hypothetical protein
MRIAAGIVTLAFMAFIAIQAFAYQNSGMIAQSAELSRAGIWGWFITGLLLFGGAFIFKFPKISINFLIVAFLVSLFINITWTILTLITIVLNGFSIKELKKTSPPAV